MLRSIMMIRVIMMTNIPANWNMNAAFTIIKGSLISSGMSRSVAVAWKPNVAQTLRNEPDWNRNAALGSWDTEEPNKNNKENGNISNANLSVSIRRKESARRNTTRDMESLVSPTAPLARITPESQRNLRPHVQRNLIVRKRLQLHAHRNLNVQLRIRFLLAQTLPDPLVKRRRLILADWMLQKGKINTLKNRVLIIVHSAELDGNGCRSLSRVSAVQCKNTGACL